MFTFEETKNPQGLFAYKVKNKRPRFLKFFIPLWLLIFTLGEIFLGICFVMVAVADAKDGISDYISRWEAINDWFMNKKLPT